MKAIQPTTEVRAAIALFIERVQAMYDAHYDNPVLPSPQLGIDYGLKVAKVTKADRRINRETGSVELAEYNGRVSKSVYCFIDLSNGDLLKAEGWKKPAKGKRGSILNDNSDVGTVATVHGGGFYK